MSGETAAPPVLFTAVEGTATLTLNRPDKRNSLTRPMLLAMNEAVTRLAGGQDGVRVLLLTGSGAAFCAGQDLSEEEAFADASAVRALLDEFYAPLVRGLRSLPFPVIAAVNGIAAGAGIGLALACDIVLASQSASFVPSFTRIGLSPAAGASFLLPRRIGAARAMGAALLAEPIPAAQAEAWGLIWKAVPDNALIKLAHDLANRLKALPAQALALTKQSLQEGLEHGFDRQLEIESDLQGRAAETEDFREALSAFLEKRPPRFSGR
jgi:2-(1,2-epoxy-1,2-dihydrophenyl)acetyl-CoA isomerase